MSIRTNLTLDWSSDKLHVCRISKLSWNAIQIYKYTYIAKLTRKWYDTLFYIFFTSMVWFVPVR